MLDIIFFRRRTNRSSSLWLLKSKACSTTWLWKWRIPAVNVPCSFFLLFHQTTNKTNKTLKSFYRYNILTELDTNHTLLAASSTRSSPPVRAAHPSQTASTLNPSLLSYSLQQLRELGMIRRHLIRKLPINSPSILPTMLNTDTALYWKSCWIRSCTACTASRHPPQYRWMFLLSTEVNCTPCFRSLYLSTTVTSTAKAHQIACTPPTEVLRHHFLDVQMQTVLIQTRKVVL